MPEQASRPLSPKEEGFYRGLTATREILHVDGQDFVAHSTAQDIDEALTERPEFVQGLEEGVEVQERLEHLGYKVVSRSEEVETILPLSGGSESSE